MTKEKKAKRKIRLEAFNGYDPSKLVEIIETTNIATLNKFIKKHGVENIKAFEFDGETRTPVSSIGKAKFSTPPAKSESKKIAEAVESVSLEDVKYINKIAATFYNKRLNPPSKFEELELSVDDIRLVSSAYRLFCQLHGAFVNYSSPFLSLAAVEQIANANIRHKNTLEGKGKYNPR